MKIRMNGDVHRLVDRAADDSAGFAFVKLRQIAAAAGKAHSKRRFGQNHASFSFRAARPAGLPMS